MVLIKRKLNAKVEVDVKIFLKQKFLLDLKGVINMHEVLMKSVIDRVTPVSEWTIANKNTKWVLDND